MLKNCLLLTVGMLALCGLSCRHDLPTQPATRWPVKGTVEDRSGLPIAGAALKFHNAKDSANAISDSAGRFEVKLWTGRYLYTASKAGHLEYRDSVELREPGIEVHVQLALDPSQDYLPLAVGNWWEYADTATSLSFGAIIGSWGTQQWEIISSAVVDDKITFLVRLDAKGKSKGIYGGPPGTVDYAYSRQFEIVESGGRVTVDLPCTVLKHFMQPGEKIPNPNSPTCDSSRVSRGMPMIVNGFRIETLEINTIGISIPSSEQTCVAAPIGIVIQKFSFGMGNNRLNRRLVLRRYFTRSALMP